MAVDNAAKNYHQPIHSWHLGGEWFGTGSIGGDYVRQTHTISSWR
jgi:hypothetical protein